MARTAQSLAAGFVFGAAYTTIFPPLGFAPLAWVALAPLLLLLDRAPRLLAAAASAAAFGAALALMATPWLVPSMQQGFEMGRAGAWLVYLGLAAYVALWFALFGASVYALRRGRVPPVLAVPAAWVLAEWGRESVGAGLPWLRIADSQYAHPSLLQGAEIIGGAGVGFAIVAVNVLVSRAVSDWWQGAADARLVARGTRRAAAALLLLALFSLGGLWRLQRVEASLASGDAGHVLRVGLVQAAIPQAERWSPVHREHNLARQLALSREAVRAGAELVVWSETSIDFEPEDPRKLFRSLAAVLGDDRERALIVGLPLRGVLGDDAVSNAALLLDAAGRARAVYHKRKLLPIAEEDPRWLLRLPGVARAIAPMLRGDPYQAGESAAPMPVRSNAREGEAAPAGVLICFEAIYSASARARADAGASWLLNVSNDAYFVGAAAREQHFSQIVLRAVETRRPIVRVANAGVGAWIEASGRVSLRVEPDETAAPVAELRPRKLEGSHRTPYQRFGFAFPGLCAGLVLLGLWPLHEARA